MRPGETAEQRLSEALRARALEVEPSPDALPRIRTRTAERHHRGWATIGAAAAAATAMAAGVAVFVPDRGAPPLPPAASSSADPPALLSREPGPPPPATPPAGGGPATVELPVYFTRNGKLYREFHALRLTADTDEGRIAAAVAESLHGDAYDPDYDTLWPGGVTVRGVSIDGGTVTVELGDVGAWPREETRPLAVQQLLYTVSAASTYTSVKKATRIRIVVDGGPAETPRQAPYADVLGPVWVIDPRYDERVGQRFTVHLAGVVFEGTVNLRIRGAGGKVVVEQVVHLSAGAPSLGEARVPVNLPPGRYTVEAFFVSVKDGSVQGVDDHDVTVG
ncbi:GerMN domain-containing protein [Dactylosporangium roseum]|uniref:GerMN domain-containing protein n=1 Tax=Dactylosporangium roseum TaxID=47989 RepID=A0ABY5YYU6_9ACTN|nr:Gmad2 immunoglobulin-like domain-containing protein [Dactylosporangium roseum]UWZ34916.1 GerMN domain-containing protein [Dactylosporangium roseum]